MSDQMLPSFVWNPDSAIADVFEYEDFTRTITVTAENATINSVVCQVKSNGVVLAPNGYQKLVKVDIVNNAASATITIHGQFQGIFDQMSVKYVDAYMKEHAALGFKLIPEKDIDVFDYTPDMRYSITIAVEVRINEGEFEVKQFTWNILNDWSHQIPSLLSVLDNRGSGKL